MPMRNSLIPAHCRAVAPGQSRGHGPADGGVPIVGGRKGRNCPASDNVPWSRSKGQPASTVTVRSPGLWSRIRSQRRDGQDVGRRLRVVSQEPLPPASQDEDRISRSIPLPDPVAARLRVGRFMDRRDASLQLQPTARPATAKSCRFSLLSGPVLAIQYGPRLYYNFRCPGPPFGFSCRQPGPEYFGGDRSLGPAAAKNGGEGWIW